MANGTLDENLSVDESGVIRCAHCSFEVGRDGQDFLSEAIWRERPAHEAGSSVVRADPALFVDRPVGLRQAICPQCYVLFVTEVVPIDEPSHRSKRIH